MAQSVIEVKGHAVWACRLGTQSPREDSRTTAITTKGLAEIQKDQTKKARSPDSAESEKHPDLKKGAE